MSELKAHKAYNRWIDEEMPTPNDDLICNEVYLKSEADKVIAEKDKEIQRLENLCASYRHDCDNLAIRESNALKEIGRDNRVIRHQKHKRCLAMASYWVAVGYQCVDNKHIQMAEKRHYKWLKLADKFKEAK